VRKAASAGRCSRSYVAAIGTATGTANRAATAVKTEDVIAAASIGIALAEHRLVVVASLMVADKTRRLSDLLSGPSTAATCTG
jgi:hypothetical protein